MNHTASRPPCRDSLVIALFCLGCWLCASLARAQPATASVAEATRLFDEAEALMREQQYAAACERYARSQALDPQLGTLLHLANCEELLGRTASALADFQAAAQLAAARRERGDPDPREEVARKRAERLSPQLAYLRLVPPAAEPPGLQITQDGERIAPEHLGSFVPIDPGPHSVRASAPGYGAWSHTLVISPATRHELPLPQLNPLRVAEPAPAAADDPARPVGLPRGAAASGTQRAAAYALGGAALVGVGVAVVLGTRANHFHSERDALCSAERCVLSPQDAAHVYAVDDKARDFAAAFNWTGALSLAALGTAVVLYLTGGEPQPASPGAVVGWGSVSVRGRL